MQLVPRSDRWSQVETPAEIRTWRSLVERDMDFQEVMAHENRAANRRLVQLAGGALVALIINLVLLVVTLGAR